MSHPIVEFREVSKSFGTFFANKNLSFAIDPGTIHGLIGENGAGKSTAMKGLFGVHSIDGGQIFIRGKAVVPQGPKHMMGLGVGMVHQHFMLAGSETALDNVIVGEEHVGLFQKIRRGKVLAELQALSAQSGIPFQAWNTRVQDLSVGDQQRLEILKLLYRGSDVFILDEPTAVLTPQEINDLFATLKRLKSAGKTVVLITHKLKEITEVTDAVTVLRRGEVVTTLRTSETNASALAKTMVGRAVSFTYSGPRTDVAPDAKVCVEVKNLRVDDPFDRVKSASFFVKSGEILGFAGVAGNGQSQTFKYLSNPSAFRGRSSGDYKTLEGAALKDQTHADPEQLRHSKIGIAPEDRHHEALVLDFNMNENFFLGQQSDARYQKYGMIQKSSVREAVVRAIHEFDIRPKAPEHPLKKMSGGNQQKLVMARTLDPAPEILYIAQPTRGVDVGSIERIHAEIMKLRNEGKAIILLSSELEELMDLCDRIAVFFDGTLMDTVHRPDFDLWTLGQRLGGSQ